MNKVVTDSHFSKIIDFRKQLHARPEVSGQEVATAAMIKEALAVLQPELLLDQLGGTGVLARLNHSKNGPSIMFRAELDALPIQEINEFEYRSQTEGVSHKCGHDGHMAILLGLAEQLRNNSNVKGSTYLLFQPAEEDGSGARAVLQDPRMAQFKPDMAFALHNLPGYPLGSVILRKGSFTASVKSLILKLEGKTSHAAEPEKGINPAVAISEILQQILPLSKPDTQDDDFGLITPVCIRMGEIAYGVSAGEGEIHLTLRAWSPEVMKNISGQILQLAAKIAQQHRLAFSHSWTNVFKANFNDQLSVDLIQEAAQRLQLDIIQLDGPIKWGEDFGAFTQSLPGAMFGLGSGTEHPALHNPDYDFPDELIPIGIQLFQTISELVSDRFDQLKPFIHKTLNN
jgi:amidohydrolase